MNESIEKIHLATDHAGFQLKEAVKNHLDRSGYTVVDHGAVELNENDDYPDFIHPAAKAVSNEPYSVGIIFGHSGQGEAMVANRYQGVRAVVYYGSEKDILTLSREHNDANVLSLGAGFLSQDEVVSAVNQWLETDFTRETRHERRIKKIDENFQGA